VARPHQKEAAKGVEGHVASPDGWLRQLASRGEGVALCSAANRFAALSFAGLDAESARFARGLARLGLAAGEAIALWLPNSANWMIAHFAAARLGLTTIPINTWSRRAEVEHLLRLGNCRAIVIDSAFRGIDFDDILASAIDALERSAHFSLRHIIDCAPAKSSRQAGSVVRLGVSDMDMSDPGEAAPSPENEAMIAFSTSGTTSLPKLAVHGAEGLIAHSYAVADAAGTTSRDIVLCALPPCGAYGHGLILASLASGAKAILCETFDLDEVVRLIASERVTMLALTEPLLRRLLDHPDANRASLASLRIVFSAGGTLEEVVRRAEEEFGFRISNVYGSSEVLALAAFWGFDTDIPTRSAAGGVLTNPKMRVRAVNASGEALPVGSSGELQFRGPGLMSHYLDNPTATAQAFGAEGWFVSQDLGVVLNDAGTAFHYIARSNDALRLKGFLVNPGEIEAMLQSHPLVAMAQVVGVPNRQGEDAAVAFVIPRGGAALGADDLQAHCRAGMASYKAPSVIRIIDAFPTTRSANGDKVVKQELREMAKAYV
jgi:fatty-acyl-CoA synthase